MCISRDVVLPPLHSPTLIHRQFRASCAMFLLLEVTERIKTSSSCHHSVQNICAWFRIPQESSYPLCPATRPEAFCLPESASSLKFEIKAFTLVDHLLVAKRRKLLSNVIGMGRERQERAKEERSLTEWKALNL